MKMQIKYFTKKGSVYICQTDASGCVWFKQDRDGVCQPLAGAIHLSRTRLQELMREYPPSARDTTFCFGNGLAKEFFDDAQREHIADIPAGAETNIFFLLSKGEDKFTLGYSSTIQRIEKSETTNPLQPAERTS
jgi:hypothetical protein